MSISGFRVDATPSLDVGGVFPCALSLLVGGGFHLFADD
jgi:hypothetical protein